MSIPGQLSRNMVRYVPYSVVGEVEESVMSTLLTDLEDSRTVLFAHHVDDPNIGMGLTENLTQYKMFTCDTGLFITLAFWEKSFVENTIYLKLLLDKLPANRRSERLPLYDVLRFHTHIIRNILPWATTKVSG